MTRPMNPEHPLVERYLSRLEDGLKSMPPADREEVVRDIRSHIAEALARAYTVELLLNPPSGPAARFEDQ